MGLHGGSWRIHSSAVDDINLITEALTWLSGVDSVIEVEKGKSALGAPQITLIARLSKKGALKSLGMLSVESLENLLEERLVDVLVSLLVLKPCELLGQRCRLLGRLQV